MAGGSAVTARNFAVMTGTHALVSSTLKKYRNGVEDLKGNMFASFTSGAAFSLVSTLGNPAAAAANPVGPAITTGIGFAVFQGGFYALGKRFAPDKAKESDDAAAFYRTDQMLDTLNLTKYKRNFRKGLLADTTLPLLTDSALHEVNVPAGPRLLILDHVGTYREAYKHDLKVRAKRSSGGAKPLES